MTHIAEILDGKKVSNDLLQKVTEDVSLLKGDRKPKLVAILAGENPASEIYVARKMKIAHQVGIESDLRRFPSSVSESELKHHLDELNNDPYVNAILVQLPLPSHINSALILQSVNVEKDVDGFHPENLGKLLLGAKPYALPCTPAGIMKLIDAYNIPIEGMRAAVVGRSNIVGKPISIMLIHRNATVTVCHSKTKDLGAILRESDIIVAATGRPGLVSADSVKPGSVIIDVGVNRLESGKIVGDVDFEAVKHKAGYITPVPGGVGPMTIAMLMVNTVHLYKIQQELRSPKEMLSTK